jgi:hypothetical protein
MIRRRRRGPTWTELVRELGLSIIDLLRAETRALQADLARSGKTAGIAAGLFAAAAAIVFWSLAMATVVVVVVLALWLPLWGAAALTLALMLLTAGVLVFVANRMLRSLEPPGVTVARHVDDLRTWWAEDLSLEVGDVVVEEHVDAEKLT